MTFFFETYGCQMNQAESSSVEQMLLARSWTQAESADLADLVIINTCSVRITAETRAAGRIAYFSALKRQRDFRILVMGCMAERLHDEFSVKYPAVDFCVGLSERGLMEDIFSSMENRADFSLHAEKPAAKYSFFPASYVPGAFQAYLPIMNGCNNFCSYCIVPYVRGREASRSLDEILAELDLYEERGVREITLLGQNVNSYSYRDPSTGETIGFPELLGRVARRIEKRGVIRWVRFMSSHPKDLSDALIEVIAREPVMCRLIHLPVQHGSNRILEAMNRRYTREAYLDLVGRIRSRIPGVTLSTDILVGFPGETEEDVQDTLGLMETVGYDAAFMYHYNPREGTRAFDLPGRIPDAVKKERLARVIKLQHAIAAGRMRERVGAEVMVLVESTSRNDKNELFGHTECGEMVVFSGLQDHSLIGHFVEAKLTGLRGRTFRAKINAIEPDNPGRC